MKESLKPGFFWMRLELAHQMFHYTFHKKVESSMLLKFETSYYSLEGLNKECSELLAALPEEDPWRKYHASFDILDWAQGLLRVSLTMGLEGYGPESGVIIRLILEAILIEKYIRYSSDALEKWYGTFGLSHIEALSLKPWPVTLNDAKDYLVNNSLIPVEDRKHWEAEWNLLSTFCAHLSGGSILERRWVGSWIPGSSRMTKKYAVSILKTYLSYLETLQIGFERLLEELKKEIIITNAKIVEREF